jgi:hypothetical protein
MAPNLLDLAFDNPTVTSNNLPEAQYLPGLEKQAALEKQLAAQQVNDCSK